MDTSRDSYWEGLSPRERLLYDLLQVGMAAALGGDQARAAGIVEAAWKSADRSKSATGSVDRLQADIMNLSCEPDTSNHGERSAFKRGHKQARHAAADLVPKLLTE